MAQMPSIRIVIPVYNDWAAAARVLAELDAQLVRSNRHADVLLVDDGSCEAMEMPVVPSRGLDTIDVLRLRTNIGHQRALAIALAYLNATAPPDTTVIMDGDGEDRPVDAPRLLEAAERERRIVFAERRRRSEGPLFALLYHSYRLLHWLLTGVSVRVGNFSAIPRESLSRLVASADLWNHYAAAVFKSRIPYATIETSRGERIAGRSHMNYAALVSHGLSAMAVFGDRIGVRLVAVTAVAALILLAALGGAFIRAWLSSAGVPAWMPLAAAAIALLVFQAFAVTLTFVFVILGRRDTATFLPLRDYPHYIRDCLPLASMPHDRISVHR